MMKKLATLLLCILLLAAAHAEAPADTSAATTEYGWALKSAERRRGGCRFKTC